MNRLPTITVIILVLLLLAGGTFWYFAYGLSPEPPGRARIEALTAPATIGWHANGYATIDAETRRDEYAALGYAHGLKSAWPMVLWREAALGRLSEHFGEDLLVIDRFARQMGFGSVARETYDQMPEEERELLDAYASGVNAALQREDTALQAPFPLLNFDPAGWQPYHTLALERLLAWAAAPPLSRALREAQYDSPAADSLARADSLLRRRLHLGGFRRSTAWAADAGNQTHLFSRLVYGNSALPLLQTVAFRRPDSSYVLGASLPGTPFFFTGMTPDRAWTILPRSAYTLGISAAPPDTVTPAYERITTPDGDEHLLRIRRAAGGLALGRTTGPFPAPDTALTGGMDTSATVARRRAALTLQWAGFEAGSDWPAWSALARGGAPSFHLLTGDGLALGRGGSWQVLGEPEHVVTMMQGVVVGNSMWTPALAMRLDSLAAATDSATTVAQWQRDCISAWAANQTRSLLTAVDSVGARRSLDSRLQEAVSYLRNWDHAYDNTSIGASIYETWAWLVQRNRGGLPGIGQPGDTSAASFFRNYQRVRLLDRAVAHLTDVAGEDMSTWRWERIHTYNFFFPVWSGGFGDHGEAAADGRYAPISLPARGHPSAPCGGATFAAPGPEAQASWEGWVETGDWGNLNVQSRRFDADRFLGRYRTSHHPPEPMTFEAFGEPGSTTTLLPSEL